MKKMRLLALSIILTTGILVGCGSKTADTKNETATTTQQTDKNNTQEDISSSKQLNTEQTQKAGNQSSNNNQTKKVEADPILQQALKEEEDFNNRHPNGYSDDDMSIEYIKTHPSEVYDRYLRSKVKGDFDTTEESKDVITSTSIKYVVEVESGSKKENHELIVELQSDKTFKVTSDKIIN